MRFWCHQAPQINQEKVLKCPATTRSESLQCGGCSYKYKKKGASHKDTEMGKLQCLPILLFIL